MELTPLFFNAGASEVSSGECSFFLTLVGEAEWENTMGFCNLRVLLGFALIGYPLEFDKS